MGLFHLLLVTALAVSNTQECDDSLPYEASYSVGVCCQIIFIVGLDYQL